MDGAKLIVVDPRLSNTASMADHWIPTWPGGETALFLSWAKIILDEGLYDREFMETQVNWQQYLQEVHPNAEESFENFIEILKEEYSEYTPEFASQAVSYTHLRAHET